MMDAIIIGAGLVPEGSATHRFREPGERPDERRDRSPVVKHSA